VQKVACFRADISVRPLGVERVNSLAVVGDVKQYAALALKNVTVFGLESNYN
jgi:hypothetical protein